jgi:hypothetical protein
VTTSEVDERVLVDGRSFDPASAVWVRELSPGSPVFEDACRRLHAMLIKIARKETARRSPVLRLTGPELEDLAHQAAADALMRITRKIGEFRGDAQFKTWAFKFVILEVSAGTSGGITECLSTTTRPSALGVPSVTNRPTRCRPSNSGPPLPMPSRMP